MISTCHEVDVIRAAQKGRKSWNPPEAMFLTRFWTNLHRKIDLDNTFKSFFRDDSFELCNNIAGFLGGRGAGGGCGAGQGRAGGSAVTDEVQRQESCPGPGGPYRLNLSVKQKPLCDIATVLQWGDVTPP